MNKAKDYLNNVLIISSHADDHLSCAGTIFKLIEDYGMVPYEIVLTDSSKGQDKRLKKEKSAKDVSALRNSELSKASRFLGIKKTFMFGIADLELTLNPALLRKVAKVIRQVRPKVVFINNEYDAHPDHREAFRIGLDSLKVAAMGVDTKTLGEAFRVPTVLCVEQMLPDRSQILVDITKFIDKKRQLLEIYASQMSLKSKAFEEGIMAVRGYHLKKANGFYAEAFNLQNEFPILGFEQNETDIF